MLRGETVSCLSRKDVQHPNVHHHRSTDHRPKVEKGGQVVLRLQLFVVRGWSSRREEQIDQARGDKSMLGETHAEVWEELFQHCWNLLRVEEQLGKGADLGKRPDVAL